MARALMVSFFTSVLLISCSDGGQSRVISVSDAQIDEAISSSDDYIIYRSNFINSTKQLVQGGKCSLSELKYVGGWVKSQSQKKQPVYFTYCGGMKLRNKIYLNVTTGEISS